MIDALASGEVSIQILSLKSLVCHGLEGDNDSWGGGSQSKQALMWYWPIKFQYSLLQNLINVKCKKQDLVSIQWMLPMAY